MLPAPPQAGFVLPPPLSLAQQVDGPTARSVQLSKKGAPWSDDEHKAFLAGLKAYGRGQWKQISRYYVPSRTPTQVASHAQKHFLRQSGAQKRRSRFSAVEEAAAVAVAAAAPLQALGAAAPGAAAAGPVPGAPALPSFFAHALAGPATQTPLQLLSATPGARLGGMPGAAQHPLPPPGAIVGGIAMGVPIGVLPPLPSITTASGTELPILPVMPGRINALAASMAAATATAATPAAAATATTSVSADSSGSELLGHASRPPSPAPTPAAVLPPLLPEVPLPLHTHSRGSAATTAPPRPAGGSHYMPPTGRTQQLLRLLELNEQQQRAASGGAAGGPAVAGDGASSGSAPTAQHSAQQQQSSVRRMPSATAALDTLAELAEAEAHSAEAATASAMAAASSAEAAAAAARQVAQQLPRVHSGQAPLVSAF
ncbi:hypothetical protein ABPG75_001789 [Micractinium tetrahymenae]